MRETPGREARRAPAQRGRGRLLPRPARAGVRRPRPEVGAARAGGLRLRRDRHRALVDRLRRARRARQADRRLPQRDERARGRAARSGSSDARVGVAGPRLLGPEPRAQLRRPRRARLDLRRGRERRLDEFAARYPQAQATSDFDDDARRRHARRGRDRHAGADALRAREAGARGRQARARREAARDARRRDGRARRPRRRRATSC